MPGARRRIATSNDISIAHYTKAGWSDNHFSVSDCVFVFVLALAIDINHCRTQQQRSCTCRTRSWSWHGSKECEWESERERSRTNWMHKYITVHYNGIPCCARYAKFISAQLIVLVGKSVHEHTPQSKACASVAHKHTDIDTSATLHRGSRTAKDAGNSDSGEKSSLSIYQTWNWFEAIRQSSTFCSQRIHSGTGVCSVSEQQAHPPILGIHYNLLFGKM